MQSPVPGRAVPCCGNISWASALPLCGSASSAISRGRTLSSTTTRIAVSMLQFECNGDQSECEQAACHFCCHGLEPPRTLPCLLHHPGLTSHTGSHNKSFLPAVASFEYYHSREKKWIPQIPESICQSAYSNHGIHQLPGPVANYRCQLVRA